MAETADVVIIGGGITGLSAAYQIARLSSLKVVLLERGLGPGEGSTGQSSAICRYKYSRDEMIQLAVDGIHAYRHWADFTQLAAPRARFTNAGVLWLGDGDADWPQADADRLATFGISACAIDDAQLAERFPAINPCRIAPDPAAMDSHECTGAGVHLLERDAGFMDPVDVLQDLVEAARAAGVSIRFGAPVTGITTYSGAVRGVTTANRRIACDTIINAAGPWCHWVDAMAGLESGPAAQWDMQPTRIQMVHVDRPQSVTGDIPVCIDPAGGLYFRPQNRGQQIIAGSVLEEDEREGVPDPGDYAQYADDAFMQRMLFGLEHRLSGLDTLRHVRGYSGLYTVNRRDVHPVVSRTALDGYICATGFSGHGFKIGPATGALLARLVTGETCAVFGTSVPDTFLSHGRAPIPVDTMSVLA